MSTSNEAKAADTAAALANKALEIRENHGKPLRACCPFSRGPGMAIEGDWRVVPGSSPDDFGVIQYPLHAVPARNGMKRGMP